MMMTDTPAPETTPALLTSRTLLFGDEDQSGSIVRTALNVHNLTARSGLGPLARRAAAGAVSDQVASMVQRLVDLDVGEALVGAWRTHRDLLAAAEKSLEHPGSRVTVVLADHDIHVDHEPAVEVLFETVRLTTVTIAVALDISVEALVGVVEHGTLIEIAHGDVHVAGSLSMYDKEVLKRSRSLSLPGWFSLRGQLRLVVDPPGSQAVGSPPSEGASDMLSATVRPS